MIEASNGNSAAAHAAKDDPLHPSNIGRFNGFLHASPNALANASEKSSIGMISKLYAAELGFYLATGAEINATNMASLLEQVANKPLTPELITAINDKLAEASLVDPLLYGMSDKALLADQIISAATLN